jgi:hypothetical protein
VAGLMIGVTLERGARHVLTPEAEGLLAAVDPLRTHISTSTKGAPRDMSFCSRCQKNSPHTLGALEHFWPRFLPAPSEEGVAPRLYRRSIARHAAFPDDGTGFWVAYGVLQGDWVIVAANKVGATLSGIVLGCKVRDIS